MNRIPSLFFIPGFVFILIGLTFAILLPRQNNQHVQALPVGHPTVIASPNGSSLVNTTRQDFIVPGTQPNQITEEIFAPGNCTYCHGDGYSQQTSLPHQPADTETWNAWAGSMMAQAGRDPIFYAAVDIANVDAALSGEFCLRCHIPRGWLNGRVQNGQLINDPFETADDLEGIQCEVCHRLVDPIYDPENPSRDLTVLAAITLPVTLPGNAAIVVDPLDHRRGPLNLTDTLGFDIHEMIGNARTTFQSPYHEDAALCGSCHNIDNPILSWDETNQSYQLNPLDEAGDLTNAFPVERTYSEWFLSEYNTPGGVYAPQFGGNREYVSTCQECHMRAITGVGGFGFDVQPNRDDYPLHDLTGANTWVPQIIPQHPAFSSTFTGTVEAQQRAQALITGTLRARYMLQNAATVAVAHVDSQLLITITNQSGHKLPSGYVEGRRMWLQVEGYDNNGTLVYTSGEYNVATADLAGYHSDPALQVYESLHGLSFDWAAQLGLPAGHSFHFMLNNTIICDNRIPPRGYQFAAFDEAGAAPYVQSEPSPDLYADGQYWDITLYDLPSTVVTGTVRLMHQIASKEYIEFLRDNNPNPDQNNGEILYELWENNEKSRPEVMVEMNFGTATAVTPALQTLINQAAAKPTDICTTGYGNTYLPMITKTD